jgi:DNA-binding NarL/FixJ family response regulator
VTVVPVRVLTVDDQPVFRDVARSLIALTPGFVIAGEAASGAEAVVAARKLRADLVLLDVRMPGMDGIETARRITATEPHAVVVLVSGHELDDVEPLVASSGAAAVVLKERLKPRLLRKLWASHGPPGRTDCSGADIGASNPST